jgi:hypothetical protein
VSLMKERIPPPFYTGGWVGRDEAFHNGEGGYRCTFKSSAPMYIRNSGVCFDLMLVLEARVNAIPRLWEAYLCLTQVPHLFVRTHFRPLTSLYR